MTDLLLLHGALGAQSQFDALKATLSDAFNVHTMDFDGHGASPATTDTFRAADFVDAVIAYMDAHHISSADIFGYSMGGFVALQIAQTHPDRVGKIFTLGTMIFWTAEQAALEVKRLNADKILEKVPDFARSLQERHSANDWRELLRKTAEMMIELGRTNPLDETALSSITNRVRIAQGDRDAMVSLADSERAYRALPNAELHVLPNTPHPFEGVSNELLNLYIRDFFRHDGE